MPDGPHARNVDGSLNLAEVCVLLDTALATASRLKVGGGEPVCHASGTFIVLSPPRGMNLGPLPWQQDKAFAAALRPCDLRPDEKAVKRDTKMRDTVEKA